MTMSVHMTFILVSAAFVLKANVCFYHIET